MNELLFWYKMASNLAKRCHSSSPDCDSSNGRHHAVHPRLPHRDRRRRLRRGPQEGRRGNDGHDESDEWQVKKDRHVLAPFGKVI